MAPEGYTIATDTKFSIDEDGNVTSTGSVTEDGVLLVEDARTHISVSKVDIAGGEEVEGATIQILDSEGNVVEEWTSAVDDEETEDVDESVHEIEGLKTGEEYTLRETVAPEGYTIATDTKFTIDESGNVTSTGSVTEGGVLLIEDALTKVTISKVDIADGEEIEGAHIEILDSEGNQVVLGKDKNDEDITEWISDGVNRLVIEGLKVGEEYTLKEIVAPEGYTVATETTFTIDENGKVTSTGSTTTDEEGNTVLLVEDAKTKVKVSKTDIADGEEVAGAHIQIIEKTINEETGEEIETVVEEWFHRGSP